MEERKLTQDEIYDQIAEWRGMTREEYGKMREANARELRRIGLELANGTKEADSVG